MVAKIKKVYYIVEAVYKGLPDKRDDLLKRAVKRPCDGGGCGFGERDNCWYYKQRRSAEAAVERIKAAKIRGVRVRLNEENDAG